MSKPLEVFESEDLLRNETVVVRYGRGKGCCKVPFRFWIAGMVLLTTYINYTTRVNMSVSIVSMVGAKNKTTVPECILIHDDEERQKLAENGNVTTTTTVRVAEALPDYGPRYDWSEPLQGTILGSYFYGYVVTSLFGGWASEWFGPTRVIFYTHLVIAIFNSLSVYSTLLDYWALIICRIIIGACAGFVYPALQVLIAKWAPPAEKGKFVSCLMGNTLGTAITWPLVGWITMHFGWSWGFHAVSLQNVIFCVIFWIIADDTPHTSKHVSEEERGFIIEAQGASVSKKKAAVPPFRAIFLSFPFWMLAVLHFGNLWGLYVQLQSVPKFMAQVVGFDLKSAGGLAALPHIVRLFTGLFYGNLEDILKRKGLMSTKMIRKTFILSSHILPGVCLILIALSRCSEVGGVTLLVLSMSLNGAATITNLRNPQDLAPNFAGTIFGIISFIGGLTGFITPAVLGQFTKHHSGVNEWVYYFVLSGSVYVLTGIIFILFGSVELQPWNEIKDKDGE